MVDNPIVTAIKKLFAAVINKARRSKMGGSPTSHKVVICQIVGGKPPLIIGQEPILPGEGKTTAAKRLVEWLYRVYKHFADVVVVDAGYAKAPFINYLLSKNIHIVARPKDDRMHMVRDAEGVFSRQVPAKTWREDKTSTSLFLYRNRRSYKNSGISAREIAEMMRSALEYIRDSLTVICQDPRTKIS
ncbi:MAG: hypothetical protein PWP44_1642 [Thermacetogenium sp.]|nr:hypothetical protein [Thermacetogenium sp.]